MKDFEKDIEQSLKALRGGGIILYPTDTIWGIGCDATNETAVQRIFALKKRKPSDSMIILLADQRDLLRYVAALDLEVFNYLEKTQKPTTIVYDGAVGLAGNLVNSNGSAGIRIVKEEFCKNLILRFHKPIVSTSANLSGMPSPQIYSEISNEVKKGVDYIVQYRQNDTTPHSPSAIVKWKNGGEITVIRPEIDCMQKFLVIQTAFIGDVVLATGIIEKLHQHFPHAQVDFLVRKGNEGLLTDHPYLNEVLTWNKKENKVGNLTKTLRLIRSRKYDTVINVQRFAATGILTAFSGAKEKIGFDKNPLSFLFSKKIKHIIGDKDKVIHEIERNHELIKSITDEVAAKPRLYPSGKDFEAVIHLKKQRYVVIAPASVWFTKQFPAKKWIEFIDKLSQHLSTYLIGAPGDKELCDEIINGCAGRPISNLCGQYNFLQSAALQKDAIMNYVNDSAPMHFASAVNAPVTAVYCSTLPSFGFGPLSDKSFIVEIEEKLACRPCTLHGRKACPLGHYDCAYKINKEQLLQTLSS